MVLPIGNFRGGGHRPVLCVHILYKALCYVLNKHWGYTCTYTYISIHKLSCLLFICTRYLYQLVYTCSLLFCDTYIHVSCTLSASIFEWGVHLSVDCWCSKSSSSIGSTSSLINSLTSLYSCCSRGGKVLGGPVINSIEGADVEWFLWGVAFWGASVEKVLAPGGLGIRVGVLSCFCAKAHPLSANFSAILPTSFALEALAWSVRVRVWFYNEWNGS